MYLPPGARAECDGNRADGVCFAVEPYSVRIYCRSFFALLAGVGAGTSWNCVKVRLAGVCGAAWSSGVPCLGIDGSGYCPDRRAIRQQAGQSGARCRIAAGSQADTSGQPGNTAEQDQRADCRSSSSTDRRHSSSAAGAQPAPQTPLNTNVVTEVGSRLGLTARQTPATVEVIDKQIIEDRGLRTTTDIAKAAVGVTGGDAPGAPAIFSMRGFAGDQLNTLYNDIWIGPSTMTGRPMDTANLERVEILKGPARCCPASAPRVARSIM